MTTMLQQLALNYAAGQVMWAYNTLMLLAFLLDPRLTGAAPMPDPALDFNAAAKAALGLEGLPQLLDLVVAHEGKLRRAAEKQARQLSMDESGSDTDTVTEAESNTESGSFSGEESSSVEGTRAKIDTSDESSLGVESDVESRLASPAAALGPLLIKMQNGAAAMLTGVAEELQSMQWLLEYLQTQPASSSQVSLAVYHVRCHVALC